MALLFKSTHVPPGDTLIHQGNTIRSSKYSTIFVRLGDVLYSIYFIREGQMEILKDGELQAILGRNDILGENPFHTATPGKSGCVVRGRFLFERIDRINIPY